MNPRVRNLILFAAALWTGACGPSSCGAPPEEQASSSPASSGGPEKPSPSPEGVNVMPVKRSTLPEDEPKSQEGAPSNKKPEAAVSTKTASAAPASPLKDLTPKTFKKALKQRRLLVMVIAPDCPDCLAAQQALESLAPEFKGQVGFARINGKEPGAAAVLPEAMLPDPLPAFILYQGGRVDSFRQGLPVPADRLKDWFRSALRSMDLAK